NTTSITSIDSLSTSLEILYIADTTSISDLQLTLNSMSSLHSVKFDNIGLSSIPDFSASSAYLTFIDLSKNGGISSVYPIISSELTYLEMFICTNCSISDLSPLYSLPNLMSISVVGNKICVGSSESTEDLAEKFKNHGVAGFSLDLGSDFSTDQTCECSSPDNIGYSDTLITDNKVCSETKPGSNSWYVICASDSYTSYTSAEDFTCTQPDSSTSNCSGGCEYGYECRYLGDEEIGDGIYTTGECQQVIVDENLHDYIASVLDSVESTLSFTHRTNDNPARFSVASLKTLESVAVETSENSFVPQINFSSQPINDLAGIEHLNSFVPQINFSSQPINDLAGIEHLVNIKAIMLNGVLSSETTEHLDLISTLTNLELLNLADNSDLFSLPDLTYLSSLEWLSVNMTSVSLPSNEYVLPSSITKFMFLSSNIDDAGFAKNVGNGYLSNLDVLYFGNTDSLISIESLSQSQIENLGVLRVVESSIGDSFNDLIANMSNLRTLILTSCDLTTIPNLTNSASTLTNINLSSNPILTSLLPLATASLTNLSTMNVSGCNISDPSPLYALSSNTSWSSIGLSYNHICGGDSAIETFLASKFPSATVDVSNQTCECSSNVALGSTPLASNKVCSETKPGSGSWYVVCASDSYTSYTSAEDFTCTQPDSSSATNCSGGCEYGYECRNDPDLESISCQQVIVDDYLHACVA
ncbi:hypothetical protein ADUPG1_000841, partial [Aduncisulcus paluster]